MSGNIPPLLQFFNMSSLHEQERHKSHLYEVYLISLRRADHSSRGVLPTVVHRCVWSRNLKNEEDMTRVGSQRHKKKNLVS